MNKSKFASVSFKPLEWPLVQFVTLGDGEYWGNSHDINSHCEYLRFHESTIEQHPELFEVTYPERKFEEGALYKAKYQDSSVWEVIKYMYGGFYRIAVNRKYIADDFYEIGDKFEL